MKGLYPKGTRLLIALHKLTGLGIHELYQLAMLRRLVTFLDRLSGKPPI